MPRPMEAACGEDLRAGLGTGRDPHEGALVSGSQNSLISASVSFNTNGHIQVFEGFDGVL